MNKRYEFIDHTADISIKVYGNKLEDIFVNASIALMELMCDIRTVKPLKSFNIDVNGITNEQLLVNLLQEILYLHEVKNFLFSSFTILSLSDCNASGTIKGEEFDNSRHELLYDIKAVTYNKLNIKKSGNQFSAVITLDI